MRTSRSIIVTLGKQQLSVDRRLASGDYKSASEVIRAALRALDREEAAVDQVIREKVRSSLADPRPDVPAEDVFTRLHAHHRARTKGKLRGA